MLDMMGLAPGKQVLQRWAPTHGQQKAHGNSLHLCRGAAGRRGISILRKNTRFCFLVEGVEARARVQNKQNPAVLETQAACSFSHVPISHQANGRAATYLMLVVLLLSLFSDSAFASVDSVSGSKRARPRENAPLSKFTASEYG